MKNKIYLIIKPLKKLFYKKNSDFNILKIKAYKYFQ